MSKLLVLILGQHLAGRRETVEDEKKKKGSVKGSKSHAARDRWSLSFSCFRVFVFCVPDKLQVKGLEAALACKLQVQGLEAVLACKLRVKGLEAVLACKLQVKGLEAALACKLQVKGLEAVLACNH